MSIEFIPAKDLPVAEGDEVDVLCVENGELKRKEGASLGGGVDAVIDLGVFSNYDTLEDLSGGSIPSGTAAMIKEKIAAGKMPKVQGVVAYQYYDMLEKSVFECTAFGNYGGSNVRFCCNIFPYSGFKTLNVEIYTDGDKDYINRVTVV